MHIVCTASALIYYQSFTNGVNPMCTSSALCVTLSSVSTVTLVTHQIRILWQHHILDLNQHSVPATLTWNRVKDRWTQSHLGLMSAVVQKWARPWENVSNAICEQQRRRSACASAQADQRLCCSLPRQNDTSSLYYWNFKILAGLCSWAGQFVSCLVGDSRRHIFSWRGSLVFVGLAKSTIFCFYRSD